LADKVLIKFSVEAQWKINLKAKFKQTSRIIFSRKNFIWQNICIVDLFVYVFIIYCVVCHSTLRL